MNEHEMLYILVVSHEGNCASCPLYVEELGVCPPLKDTNWRIKNSEEAKKSTRIDCPLSRLRESLISKGGITHE